MALGLEDRGCYGERSPRLVGNLRDPSKMNSPYHLILKILYRLSIAVILILSFFAVIDLTGPTDFMPRLSHEFGRLDNAVFWLIFLFISIFVFVLPIKKARKALEKGDT